MSSWLLEPEPKGAVPPRDHVMMVCPTCDREGSVHRSIVESGSRVICSGGRKDDKPKGQWGMTTDPPHPPTECRIVDVPKREEPCKTQST